ALVGVSAFTSPGAREAFEQRPLPSFHHRGTTGGDARAPRELVSLALSRRPYDGGSDTRARLHRHGHLRQASASSKWRSLAAGGALEVWVQVHQVLGRPGFRGGA